MDFAIDFNSLIAIVYGIGAIIALASVFIMFEIVRMRYVLRAADKRRSDFEARWKPILDGTEVVASLPTIRREERTWFLRLWNEERRKIASEPHPGQRRVTLAGLAERTQSLEYARVLAAKGDVADRVIALTTLGWLRNSADLAIATELADSPNPVISITAAHAMLQIDPTQAGRFLELRLSRSDWPPAKVDAIVEEECPTLQPALLDAIFGLPEGTRLVRYLLYCPAEKMLPVLTRVLETSQDVPTLIAALKVLGRCGAPEQATFARKFLHHSDWYVRVQAAHALGRLGNAGDVEDLSALLRDGEWWVRLRAAEAIAALAKDGAAVERIRDEQKDRYAREMLNHVIAERQFAVPGGQQ